MNINDTFDALRPLVKSKTPAEIAAESGLSEGTAKRLRYGKDYPARISNKNSRLLARYLDRLRSGEVGKVAEARATYGRTDVASELYRINGLEMDEMSRTLRIEALAAAYRAEALAATARALEAEAHAAGEVARAVASAEQGAAARAVRPAAARGPDVAEPIPMAVAEPAPALAKRHRQG